MKPKRLGSVIPIGGNVPILGQKKKKPDAKSVPRFSAEQLQEFLFDIAFGFCERTTAIEMKLEIIEQELGVDLTLEEGEYKTRFEQNLPLVMKAFGFLQDDDEGVTK